MSTPPLLVLLALLGLAPVARSAALGLPVRHAGEAGPAAPYFSGEVLEIRLTPGAALAARHTLAGTRIARPRLEWLGVESVDRTALALGAWLEPEFVGESAPPEGSGETDFTAFYLLHPGAGVELADALDRMRASPDVERADPIAVVPVAAVPNDSLWGGSTWFYQPSRHDIHAPEAWDLTTGDTAIVVAVLDTGVLPYHPDLGGRIAGSAGQMWINGKEKAGLPGIDDDLNGFVDDVSGWDFVNLSSASDVSAGEDWQSPDNDPNDYAGHGTFVAGLIGALTDNTIGVAGMSWKVRIMPLRMAWSALSAPLGLVDMSYAAQAIRYATRMGASVINCSFATINSGGLYAAAAAAARAGATLVVASGNNGQPHELADREDVIGVAATGPDDVVAAFSNLGDFVDLSAPGEAMASTFLAHADVDSIGARRPAYASGLSGTSFAAPLVSGAVALLQARQRALGRRPLYPTGALLRLRETADDIAAQNPTTTGYGTGRLDVARALTEIQGSTAARASATTIGPAVLLPAVSGRVTLAWAMANSRLLLVDGVSGDTLALAALPGGPARQLAAADMGGGLGVRMFVGTVNGKLAAFDRGGQPLAPWPASSSGNLYGFTGGPALGDLDGDGALEVVCGCTDGLLYAWSAVADPITNFPVALGAAVSAPVALGPLDGLPGVEIVVGTADAKLHVLDGFGNERSGWPVTLAGPPFAPVIARLGSSGTPAIVAVAGGTLYAFSPGGVLRFSVPLGGSAIQDPAVADLDGDGFAEIVVPLSSPSAVAVFDSAGVPLTSRGWPRALAALPTGPPVVGPLRTGARAGVLIMQGGALAALTDSAQTIPRFPAPGGAGTAPTLVELDGDGATEVVAGSGQDSVLYVYDAGPGTWSEQAAAWPTPRGNFARTGDTDYAPALPPRDDVAPSAIPDLAGGVVTRDSIQLTWTAPGNDGMVGRAASYRLHVTARREVVWDFSGGDVRADLPPPDSAGAAQRFTLAVRAGNVAYFFALRTLDAAGNASAISNVSAVLTPLGSSHPVTTLAAGAVTESSVTVCWQAPEGVPRPTAYDVLASSSPLDESSRVSAERRGVQAGVERDSLRFGGLGPGRVYWFAVVALESRGMASPLSNVISVRTAGGGPLAVRSAIALAAGRRPARAPVALFWQGAPGTAGVTAHIRIYDVAGRCLRTLECARGSDSGEVSWDGRDEDGRGTQAGLYFARLTFGGRHAETKLIVMP